MWVSCMYVMNLCICVGVCDRYMVDVDMLKVLQHVKHMGIEDEETVADITFLEEKLESGLQDMSTFDEYRKEVFSNLVDGWTPVHKCAPVGCGLSAFALSETRFGNFLSACTWW